MATAGDIHRTADRGKPMSEREDLRSRLGGIIPAEEKVLWMGQPDLPRAFRKGVVHSVAWLFFLAIFIGIDSVGQEGPWRGLGWPARTLDQGGLSEFFRYVDKVVFVVMGCLVLASPHLAVRDARRTLYAVTPLRLLIVYLRRSPVTESFLLSKLPFLECRERKDGTGDLVFSKREKSDGDGGTQVVKIGFLGVRKIRTVETLVRSLLGSGSRSA